MSSLGFGDVTVRYSKRVAVEWSTYTVCSGSWLGLIGPRAGFGVVSAFFGAPFLIVLLRTRRVAR